MICWFYPTDISQTARIIFELTMTKSFAPFIGIFIVLRKAPLLFVKLKLWLQLIPSTIPNYIMYDKRLHGNAWCKSAYLFNISFRVDRLNVSIDTQTEMLENLVRMLAAKEKEAPHPSADIKLWRLQIHVGSNERAWKLNLD